MNFSHPLVDNNLHTRFIIRCYLNIQIDFYPDFYPAYEQRLFNCGQFGLTPPLNIYFIDFVSSLIKRKPVLF